MFRILLTGLLLSLPAAALAQQSDSDPASDQPKAAAPAAETVAKPVPKPAEAAKAAEAERPEDKPKAAPVESPPPPAPVPAPATQPPAQPPTPKPETEAGAKPAPAPASDAQAQAQAAPGAGTPPAPSQALTNDLPNLFDVTVIETWDTLNVRESPDGQAKVIATLPATAKGVELLARDPGGKWGKVNAGEHSGWVALRFLKQQAGVWQPAAIPQTLACAGTEPFWSLKASKSGMTFAEPDQPDRALSLRKVLDRGIEGEPTRGLIAGDDKSRFTAFIRPAQCSDGMSDRGYALAVSVIVDGQDIPSRMLSGCCSIAR
ncbi:MAG: SH3 domain-containing protein [Paracoccus sp. (in: a-proteobacteria)]|uniref:COG3650 family protein n=1 Tax=Paracoccus sp. TaxID=267 RepID=UPI0039E62E01